MMNSKAILFRSPCFSPSVLYLPSFCFLSFSLLTFLISSISYEVNKNTTCVFSLFYNSSEPLVEAACLRSPSTHHGTEWHRLRPGALISCTCRSNSSLSGSKLNRRGCTTISVLTGGIYTRECHSLQVMCNSHKSRCTIAEQTVIWGIVQEVSV